MFCVRTEGKSIEIGKQRRHLFGACSGSKERQVVKCYLESHLAHKDGSKDVVGNGEKDSFLCEQKRET